MRYAALTLTMALSLLSACADTIDRGVPAFNAAPNSGMASSRATYISTPNAANVANVSVPFFTTDPACCNNPQPAYNGGEMVYLGSAPFYASDFGYFVGSGHGVRNAYYPSRGGGGHARAGGFSHHR